MDAVTGGGRVDQDDGIDELFGESFRQTGELPTRAQVRAAAPELPVAPVASTLPQVGLPQAGTSQAAQPLGTAPQQLVAAPPPFAAAPTIGTHGAGTTQAFETPVHVAPITGQTPHMMAPPTAPPLAQPASLPPSNVFVRPEPHPQPVVPPAVRRNPNEPFDFQLRPRREHPRTTAFEWSSLVFAIIVPPIGLVLSIIARGIARAQRRWRTRVAGAATTVSVILTIVLAGGAGVYLELQRLAAVEAELARATAPLCNLEEQSPGTLESSTLGWPPVAGSIAESVASIDAYHEQWNYLARVLPAGVKADAAAVAAAALEIRTQVETARTIDDAANVARMSAVVSGLGIADWAAEYCG